jgi:hypothetical protein
MKIVASRSWIVGLGVVLSVMVGCGSGATSEADNQQLDQGSEAKEADNNETETTQTPDPIVAGYSMGEGILIETRSDGTKRAWVNTRGSECLIYRIAQHPGTTIVGGGMAHCEGLNFGGIDSWRMPTEEEALYLMAHANEGQKRLIYPDDNPRCLFMATDTSGRFVYTTNSQNIGAFTEESRQTAGIRCVADQ